MVSFTCNICGHAATVPLERLGREVAGCPACQSTVRHRALIRLLSQELFGGPVALPDFPILKRIRGIGLSDWPGYAKPLAEKLDYVNTYYHQEPRLDITAIPSAMEGQCDFLISSEVFEHVAPPVETVLRNAWRLLKPDGFLLLTVPYTLLAETTEHFPELHDYTLAQLGERAVLLNRTHAGELQIFENLAFHGGPGATLEVRQFGGAQLMEQLRGAGFASVEVARADDVQCGVVHRETWSLPIVARRGPGSFHMEWARELISRGNGRERELARITAALAATEAALAERTGWAAAKERELAEQTAWALSLDAELAGTRAALQRLQVEFAERTQWALALKAELSDRARELHEREEQRSTLAAHLVELTQTADRLRTQLQGVQTSRWVRLGRKAGVGPEV